MTAAAPRVQAAGVCVRLGGVAVIDDATFTCRPGEWTVVTGPSGIGKTTLLRAVNGLCDPSRGILTVLGTALPGRGRREARDAWRRTGTVLQELALFESKSACRNVELALRAAGLERARVRDTAAEWLERLGLGGKLRALPAELSVGQRQRVALARALASRPDLLLLDEPTSALDGATARVVIDVLCELRDGGAAILMSSHREAEVRNDCDQLLVLRDGRIGAGSGRSGGAAAA